MAAKIRSMSRGTDRCLRSTGSPKVTVTSGRPRMLATCGTDEERGQTFSVPVMAKGMTGTLVSWASRAAPGKPVIGSKKWIPRGIVPSGIIATISPPARERTAAAKASALFGSSCLRSTLIPPPARKKAPSPGMSKSSFFPRKRAVRGVRPMATTIAATSKYDRWLPTRIAGPLAGTFSVPLMVNFA